MGFWPPVDFHVGTNVSEEHTDFIFSLPSILTPSLSPHKYLTDTKTRWLNHIVLGWSEAKATHRCKESTTKPIQTRSNLLQYLASRRYGCNCITNETTINKKSTGKPKRNRPLERRNWRCLAAPCISVLACFSGRREPLLCVCAADRALEGRGAESVSWFPGIAPVRALQPQRQAIRAGVSSSDHRVPHPEQR